MSHSKREPRSPYARYGKKPFVYSGAYHNWRSAVSEEERIDADRKFRKAFGVPETAPKLTTGFGYIGERA